jgi:hypothetical protein
MVDFEIASASTGSIALSGDRLVYRTKGVR